MKRFLILIPIVLVLLLVPVIFKEKGQPALVGPDLSEVEYLEVSFENQPEGLQLSGMLFLPEGEGPFPTAIFIHGSGPSQRKAVAPVSTAKHLQSKGVAVLIPDKRGCQQSEGEWVGASIEDLATDTLSAVEFVRDQQLFEPSAIGLIGASQGGWIASVVAAESGDVSFVVSASGATVTTDEQLLYEQFSNVERYTYALIARLIAPIATNNLKHKDDISALMGFDPIPYWKNVDVPAFFAYGENDKNVPVDASIKRLKENGLNNFQVKIYPDGGHSIRDIQTNEVSDEYLDDLVRFIKEASQQPTA